MSDPGAPFTAFSRRTNWPQQPNALTLEVEALRRTGETWVDLTVSNPTLCGWPAPHMALELEPVYTPNPLGLMTTRTAIAEYSAAHGGKVQPDHIWLASGTSELYAQLMAITADPGDVWLVPTPGYPLFDYIADLSGIQLVSYPLCHDGDWHIDLAGLRQALRRHSNVRAIVVVSPHNPTGHVCSDADYQQMVQLCAEFNAALIMDEVFLDYPLSLDTLLPTRAHTPEVATFTVSGLSKVAALPQAKVSWAIASGPEDRVEEAMRRAEWIGDTFLSLPSGIQQRLPELLQQAPARQQLICERCRTNLQNAFEILQGTMITPIAPTAGWSLLVRLPATSTDEEWAIRCLREARTLIQPGSWYNLYSVFSAPYGVLSLITPPDRFAEGLQQMASESLDPAK